MYKTKNPLSEPPYRRVRFDPRYESKAWGELVNTGVSFDHIAKHEYRITSGQCDLLSRQRIPYEKLD